MRVLVIGSGGREHAIAWRLAQDPMVTDVLSAPGNPGMAAIGRCLPVSVTDPAAVLALVQAEQVDLTVVGPEAALDAGVADLLRDAGHAVVGPRRAAAALETSKAFSKQFMAEHHIPTARFRTCEDLESALEAVSGAAFGFPVVVKADGLAGGKGVVIAADRAEAEQAVRAAMVDGQFGAAGQTLVIEECLTGPEVSFFVLCDGLRAQPLGTAQDHKRAFDGDRGPNTGGMGAFAPSPLWTPQLEDEVMRTVVAPVLSGMAADGGYRGFLYVSLMLTPAGPKVIEFNVRFGDPETQVLWPLLEGPIAATLRDAANGCLGAHTVTLASAACVGVVLAAPGYPAAPATGQEIVGADSSLGADVRLFHAGTRMSHDVLVVSGGRVLTVVATAPTHAEAMRRAYAAVPRIAFDGMFYRSDIGAKAIS
ncbi:MAG: phosphoribosylamine--glycine ligase [Vicinamibacterales bacterium]